jgi:hypothetical protein
MKTILCIAILCTTFFVACKKSNSDSKKAWAVPVVVTSPVTNITTTVATCGGTVATDDSTNFISSRGVYVSYTPNQQQITAWQTNDGFGTGSYTSTITGLRPATTYYVRAWAANTVGFGIGQEVVFTTP